MLGLPEIEDLAESTSATVIHNPAVPLIARLIVTLTLKLHLFNHGDFWLYNRKALQLSQQISMEIRTKCKTLH